MDIRKLLPAMLLGTALAVSGTAVLAKERGGNDRGGQSEARGGDRETRDGKTDRDNVQNEDRGGKDGEVNDGNGGGRDPDNVQYEDRGGKDGENGGGGDAARLMQR